MRGQDDVYTVMKMLGWPTKASLTYLQWVPDDDDKDGSASNVVCELLIIDMCIFVQVQIWWLPEYHGSLNCTMKWMNKMVF